MRVPATGCALTMGLSEGSLDFIFFVPRPCGHEASAVVGAPSRWCPVGMAVRPESSESTQPDAHVSSMLFTVGSQDTRRCGCLYAGSPRERLMFRAPCPVGDTMRCSRRLTTPPC